MKISIITVCLNSEQTIEQTIQSVINQNDSDYEYIIVDGKSTDNTLNIIDKYKNKISAIVSEHDNGIYDAMNKGIALATGEIIGIINSDDWYEPGTFREVKKCFQNSDAELVYGNMNLIFDSEMKKTLVPKDLEKIRYEMEVPHPTVFIKKEIYEKYGKYNTQYRIAADYELILRLYVAGVKFLHCNKTFADFRMSGVSCRQEELTTKETLLISREYLSYAPVNRREYYKNIIMHRWDIWKFERILKDSTAILFDILNKKLGVGGLDDLVIFGAGDWGKKVYKILCQSGVRPIYVVDNDTKKWGDTENDIRVMSPESLKTFKGELLIIAKEFSKEILSQVKKMSNPNIYPITWEEIAREVNILQ